MSQSTKQMFINEKLYTDVRSWKVLFVSADGKKATVVSVRKESRIKPDFHPGGFVGNVSNLEEMFREGNYDLVEEGNPFEVILKTVRKNGRSEDVWGYMGLANFRRFALKDEKACDEMIARSYAMQEEEIESGECTCFAKWEKVFKDGIWYVEATETTRTGRNKMRFVPMGKMSDRCEYFYDMNF